MDFKGKAFVAFVIAVLTRISDVCPDSGFNATEEERSEARSLATCRDREGAYWIPDVFHLRACAGCYGYLFRETRDLRPYQTVLVSFNGTVYPDMTVLIPDVHNATLQARVCRTLDNDECNRWRLCCLEAERCCARNAKPVPAGGGASQLSQRQCPATWDGFGCWGDTLINQEVSQSCPTFIPHAIPSVKAYKYCTSNATWYRNNDTGKEWTNYTTCLDLDHFRTEVYISLVCNGASIALLVPALLIFLAYRSLRKQHRIRLHLQLFFSFLLNALVTVLWETLVVYDRMNNKSSSTRMHKNTVGCKLLYVLTRYTKSSNFLWMLFEGFYLHRLIVKAFQPPKSLALFYIIGWGFPWIPIIIYSGLKSAYLDESCWINNFGPVEWLIYVPNLLSLMANMFFLFDILRILLTQLQSHPNEPSNYRRALKATAILVPLFGLQLVAIIYRPPPTASGSQQYEMISVFVTNSQGFFVALIFCFLNNEVLSHLRTCFKVGAGRHMPRLRKGNSSRCPSSATHTTMDCYTKEGARSSALIPFTKRTSHKTSNSHFPRKAYLPIREEGNSLNGNSRQLQGNEINGCEDRL